MTTNPVNEINAQLQFTDPLPDLSFQDQGIWKQSVSLLLFQKWLKEMEIVEGNHGKGCEKNHHGVCAICLSKIELQETALVKGCEHAYCVTCILRWATYKNEPTCPQCKHPFLFLNLHRSLDGSIQDYMFEESVCLLLRASWFTPLVVEYCDEVDDEVEDYYDNYVDDGEDLDEVYFESSPSLRIGNRRWGDNGYVRAGRQEARPAKPVYRPNIQDSGAGSSREPKKKEAMKETAAVGRRAKRALKREAADKAAAAKHQEHLVRFGRM